MSNRELKGLMSDLQSWGRQTLLFTMNMRAIEIGKMQDSVDFVDLMRTEAEKTAEELWKAALSECSKPIKPAELMRIFVTQILDWCANHRKN